MEALMEKRNWFGYGLYLYAVAGIVTLCFFLLKMQYEFLFPIPIGCGTCAGSIRGEQIEQITYKTPLFFVFPALALWGARCQLRHLYISTRLLQMGLIIWSCTLLLTWSAMFSRHFAIWLLISIPLGTTILFLKMLLPMEKRNWCGMSLDLFAILAILTISIFIVIRTIDYHWMSGNMMGCGTPAMSAREEVTSIAPFFFVGSFLAIRGARRQFQDTYISTNLLHICIALWLGAVCLVNR
jgi:hypothetical protein